MLTFNKTQICAEKQAGKPNECR
uniref:Uncharacterized protein n=1 Tax=Anguilla anguilla TaxID=7936 RepID=A0A0E9XH38_ANGAN